MTTPSEYYCVPGDRLCAADVVLSGPGTYERQNFIYASIAGEISLTTTDQSNVKPTISVVRRDRTLAIPSVGALAYCKVTQVSSRRIRCIIFAINNQPMKTISHGQINRENIDSVNRDSVICSDKFRPDDIILARIIALGDSKGYLLSTAEENLGVIGARAENGEKLEPYSDCQMISTLSKLVETRKVAKIQGDLIEEVQRSS